MRAACPALTYAATRTNAEHAVQSCCERAASLVRWLVQEVSRYWRFILCMLLVMLLRASCFVHVASCMLLRVCCSETCAVKLSGPNAIVISFIVLYPEVGYGVRACVQATYTSYPSH